jgi:hypothetical protein
MIHEAASRVPWKASFVAEVETGDPQQITESLAIFRDGQGLTYPGACKLPQLTMGCEGWKIVIT